MQKLVAQDASGLEEFGWSVAISGDTMVVGAMVDDDVAPEAGSAYVFVRSGTTWVQQAKLTAADGAADDRFGFSVSIGGDTIVVGSLLDDDAGVDAGSAYVFARNGTVWTQQAKLTAADGVAWDLFGDSVSIDGETIVVGVLGDDDAGEYAGSAYIFTASELPSLVVTTLDDAADPEDGQTSLREAIDYANTKEGPDKITFAEGLTGTITLSEALPDLSTDMTISGPGADVVTVARSTAEGTPEFPIFKVTSQGEVELSGLTITGGRRDQGGGICHVSLGELRVTNCTLRANKAVDYGGAIYTFGGEVRVVNSTIEQNEATSGSGGGIAIGSGTIWVIGSTVSANTAYTCGGGICNFGGTLTVVNSTVSRNWARFGDAVANYDYHLNASTTLINVTVVRNEGSLLSGVYAPVGVVSAQNTIFYGGAGVSIIGPGFVSNGHNLFCDAPPVPLDASDLTDTDPMLGPLQDNSGPTWTHALLAGSPAIGAALPLAEITTDQRGVSRPQGLAPDIGAFELEPEPAGLVVTTLDDVVDPFDYQTGLREAIDYANAKEGPDTITFAEGLTGTITLAQALPDLSTDLTIAGPGADLLTVARSTAEGTPEFGIFTVTSMGEVGLFGLTITGGWIAGGAGIQHENGTLSVTYCNLIGNHASNQGGAILSKSGQLYVTNCILSGNSAGGGGGAVTVWDGSTARIEGCALAGNSAAEGGAIDTAGELHVTNCTLSENSASSGSGGGIQVGPAGGAWVEGSTLTGNSAVDSGGGIASGGELHVTNCTVSENSAFLYGGGICVSLGTAALTNITVNAGDASVTAAVEALGGAVTAVNSVFHPGAGGSVHCSGVGTFTSLGHNLFSDSPDVTPAPTDLVNTDPMLGPLRDNSGPTWTHALLVGSPAIGAASPLTDITTDQRGVARPVGLLPDIGAFEYDGPPELPSLVVTTLADAADPYDFRTSLREAIDYANMKRGADTVTFVKGLTGTITLTQALPDVSTEVTIAGPGSDVLTVARDADETPSAFRIFAIGPGAVVEISGLTIRGRQRDTGGGVQNTGTTLTLRDVMLIENTALAGGGVWNGPGSSVELLNTTLAENHADIGGGGVSNAGMLLAVDSLIMGNEGGESGGGLVNAGTAELRDTAFRWNKANDGGGVSNQEGASVSLTRVTLTGNVALTGNGGGIASGGTLELTLCTLRNNFAEVCGGGIWNDGDTATITDSTLGENVAMEGGGIFSEGGLTLTGSTLDTNQAMLGAGMAVAGHSEVVNSTFSGNTAVTRRGGGSVFVPRGGAIENAGDLQIAFSTFSGNTAAAAGGIYNVAGSDMPPAQLLVGYSIFDSGTCGSVVNDGGTATSVGFSLFSDDPTAGGLVPLSGADLINTAPQLGELAENGGPTKTHMPDRSSRAIEGVWRMVPIATDQRGITRPQGTFLDIGAVEVEGVETSGLLVTTLLDRPDPFDFETSLREAIIYANFTKGADTIKFLAGLNGTISLGEELPYLSSDLTIDGPGAEVITVARRLGRDVPPFRVFTIPGESVVQISGLTIENGSSEFGGGIANEGDLTVTACVLRGNFAGGFGGGIFNTGSLRLEDSQLLDNQAAGAAGISNGGTLEVVGSTLHHNIAEAYGGGIWNDGGMVTITDSTLDDNHAEAGGGVLNIAGTVSISGTTLWLNEATQEGGAILNYAGTLQVVNSTFSENRAAYGGGLYDYLGAVGIGYATFFANQADQGGAIYNWFPGGVFFVPPTSSAAAGAPRSPYPPPELGPVRFVNTIFDQSTGGSIWGIAESTESLGHNLFSDIPMIPYLRSDIVNRSPLLEELNKNGGPTQTHRIDRFSPARDKGTALEGVSTDQRGVPRPQEIAPDIGAFEYQPPPPPGAPDPNFNLFGQVTTDFGPGYTGVAFDVAIQADGKILAVGGLEHDDPPFMDFLVARYTADGELDPDFGDDGVAITDFGVTNEYATAVVIQPDGKIMVSGGQIFMPMGYMAVARYLPNGQLDTAFGNQGKVMLNADVLGITVITGYGAALQPDGKIVLVGNTYDQETPYTDFAVVRLLDNGTLDPSFGDGGLVTTDFVYPNDSGEDYAYDVKVDADGRIVVLGRSASMWPENSRSIALARYDTQGNLDPTFGVGGRATVEVPNVTDQAFPRLALQADGKIVAAGAMATSLDGSSDFAVARFDSHGDPDSTFGEDGFVTTPVLGNGNASALDVAIQADGKILAAGFAGTPGEDLDFALARYLPDGNLDPDFGDNGVLTIDFGPLADAALAVAIQADNQIVLAGYANAPTGAFSGQFALARVVGGPLALTLDPGTVADDLQAIVSVLDASSSSALSDVTLSADTAAELAAAIAAVEGLSVDPAGPTIQIVIDLGAGTYSGLTLSPPAGTRVVIRGAGGQVVFQGSSPALTVPSGEVAVESGVTFRNDTNSPTILVLGGSLTLHGCVVEETTHGNQAAISILGGTVDLGTPEDAGNNTIEVHGRGDLIRNIAECNVWAVGNTFLVDGEDITADPYRIEDEIIHALDAGGGGLVTYVPDNVFVTRKSGSVQRGVNAVAEGGTVHVEAGFLRPYDSGARLIAVTFESGPTLTLEYDPHQPGETRLVVVGTANSEWIEFERGARCGEVTVRYNGLALGTHRPSSRVIAQGEAGNDILSTGCHGSST